MHNGVLALPECQPKDKDYKSVIRKKGILKALYVIIEHKS